MYIKNSSNVRVRKEEKEGEREGGEGGGGERDREGQIESSDRGRWRENLPSPFFSEWLSMSYLQEVLRCEDG